MMTEGAPWLIINGLLSIYADEIEERFVQAGGPGGQHVNKVATAVQLKFFAGQARGLTEPIKSRLFALAKHLTSTDGAIRIEAKRFRSQERNRVDAKERLKALILKAAEPPPPPRRPTRPTRASVRRRLDGKTARKTIKQNRGSVQRDHDG